MNKTAKLTGKNNEGATEMEEIENSRSGLTFQPALTVSKFSINDSCFHYDMAVNGRLFSKG